MKRILAEKRGRGKILKGKKKEKNKNRVWERKTVKKTEKKV